jgi:nucleoside-diphosphate-sugar epimerase
MNESYLVTGATGFVGACLTRALVKQGKAVNILVRDKNLNWRLNDISSKLNIYECDITDKKLGHVMDKIKPSHIFHLAAYGSLPQQDNFDQMILVNLKGTKNLIDVLEKFDYKVFVNTGSSSEYGIKEDQMSEKDILAPVNDYGVTKASATLYSQKQANRTGKPIITLRLFSPYGYYEDINRLIPSLILKALKNETIELSSPKNVRDFIFIEDVVNAYIKVSNSDFKSGEIFNVGSGNQHNVKEVVDQVMSLTNSKSKILWKKIIVQKRQIEPQTWEANIEKIKSELDWRPKHSLSEGLRKTVDWFRVNRHLYERN